MSNHKLIAAFGHYFAAGTPSLILKLAFSLSLPICFCKSVFTQPVALNIFSNLAFKCRVITSSLIIFKTLEYSDLISVVVNTHDQTSKYLLFLSKEGESLFFKISHSAVILSILNDNLVV